MSTKQFAIVVVLIWMFGNKSAFGQIDFNQINNQHNSNSASQYLPSFIGRDVKSFDLHIINFHFTAGNSFLSLYDADHLGDNFKGDQTYIDHLIKRSLKRNIIYAGTELELLNMEKAIYREEKQFICFGLGFRQKNDFQFNFDKNILELLYRGNKPLAGKSIDLLPNLSFLSYLDYFLSFSININSLNESKLKFKPAVTIHRIAGLSNFNMRDAHINMYTAPDGRYIDFDADLTANFAPGIDSSAFSEVQSSDIIKKAGKFFINGFGGGWSVDLGTTVTVNENIDLSASLIEFGYVKFNQKSMSYSKKATVHYEGLDISGFLNPVITSPLNIDSAKSILNPEVTSGSYRINMPTKFLISAFIHSEAKEQRTVIFYKHSLYFTYVQGFSNYLSSTTNPLFNIGYTHSIGNVVNVGVSNTVGGMYRWMGGGFISFRLLFVKISFGSNNILPIVLPKAGRGTDAYFNLSFYF